MKRIMISFLMAIFCFYATSTRTCATEVTGTLLLQPGEIQRYVSFPFTVPAEENVMVLRYERGSRFFEKDGTWQELAPLTNVPEYGGHAGFYWFINNTGNVVQINGTPHEAKLSTSFLDIDRVDDLGLFSHEGLLNDYGLPEKSNVWSYFLINNVSGDFVYPQDIIDYIDQNLDEDFGNKLIAFLVASDNGAWSRFYLQSDSSLNHMSFDDNDIVVCIVYKGGNWKKNSRAVRKHIRKINREIFDVKK